jgi:hypothetical protein
MAVFISHKKEDENIAKQVDGALKAKGIDTYLDILDPALIDKMNITTKILSGLNKCSHLLAIVSSKTSESWWVPFEIGVATKGDKRICTYSIVPVSSLPDYLTMWPVVIQISQIELFAARYMKDKLILEKAYKTYEASTTLIQTANDFHRLLKGDLGQK